MERMFKVRLRAEEGYQMKVTLNEALDLLQKDRPGMDRVKAGIMLLKGRVMGTEEYAIEAEPAGEIDWIG